MAIRCSQEANLTFRFACCACEGFFVVQATVLKLGCNNAAGEEAMG